MNPDDVDLTIVVVAHQQRHAQAAELARTLGAVMVLDDGSLGAWGNHVRALRLGQSVGATHILTIEDDANPVDNLAFHTVTAITYRPMSILGLYVGTFYPTTSQYAVSRAARRAEAYGAAWLHHPALLWGVATVYPTRIVDQLLRHPHVRSEGLAYDERMSLGTPDFGGVYYTWPSLVDHLDGPSLITQRGKHRERKRDRVAIRTGVPVWNDQSVEIG